MEGIKSDEPSPVCQELKDSLLAGDTQHAREILEKVASCLQERMRTPQRKTGGEWAYGEKGSGIAPKICFCTQTNARRFKAGSRKES